MAPYLGQIEEASFSLASPVITAKSEPHVLTARGQTSLLWDGADLARNEASFVYTLTELERIEVGEALDKFLDLELDGDKVSPATFPLPTLGPILGKLAADLHVGKGFFVIRGLDPADFSDEDNMILFLGLSSYIGGVRGKQTDDGSILGHLHNPLGLTSPHLARPLKYSKRFAEFHNDIGCDIIAMQVRSLAAQGGDHLVASAAKVLEHITRVRPDLAEALLMPNWPFDIQRRWSTTETRAVLFRTDNGRIASSLIPDALNGPPGGLQRPSGLPLLTARQIEALAFFQEVATTYQLRMQLQPGDLIYINNLALVHGRDAFEDTADQARYLVRMWLRNEELAWRVPEPLKLANYMVFYDQQLPEKWNIHRLDNVKFEVYERLTP